MTQVLLNIKNDELLPFLMELLKRLEFVEVVSAKSKRYAEIQESLQRSIHEIEMDLTGENLLPTAKESLDALRREINA